eukprot:1628151-Rhodomonas_salina.1
MVVGGGSRLLRNLRAKRPSTPRLQLEIAEICAQQARPQAQEEWEGGKEFIQAERPARPTLVVHSARYVSTGHGVAGS